MTASSVAVTHEKGRTRVSKFLHANSLDSRQSKKADNSVCKRFCNHNTQKKDFAITIHKKKVWQDAKQECCSYPNSLNV